MIRINNMVPRCRSLIDISHKYNAQNVLSFIVTDNTGITQAGLTYLYKYPDPFYNLSILPVAHPLVMYNLSESVNEVDSHNKSRKSYTALEKLWVTQCCWL